MQLRLEVVPLPVTDVDRAKAFYVIDDADAAQAEPAGRGLPVSDVDEREWGRFVHFSDPDGNAWSPQQLPARA